jgi:hypothetical protein
VLGYSGSAAASTPCGTAIPSSCWAATRLEQIGLTAARLLQELIAGGQPAGGREIRIRSGLLIGGSN